MESVMGFDREATGELRDEINTVLATLGARLGISLKVGRGTFTRDNVKFELIAATITPSGEVQTPERTQYISSAIIHGLKLEWLDQTFTSHGGVKYTITGLNPKSRSYPVRAKRGDGQAVKLSALAVRQMVEWGGRPQYRE